MTTSPRVERSRRGLGLLVTPGSWPVPSKMGPDSSFLNHLRVLGYGTLRERERLVSGVGADKPQMILRTIGV